MKKYTVDELKEIFKESPYSSGHTMQFLKWLDHLSEEKDQYGHKIIRPTIPDNAFDGLKEKIQAKAKQEDWEEELELLFCKPWGTKEVKSFISQLLKKEREKVIEEVKKNTKDLTKYETEFTCPCGIEHSVQFLIRKPKVMKGKITEITINSQQLKK